jgi:ribosomal protein L11 methylase PrmA
VAEDDHAATTVPDGAVRDAGSYRDPAGFVFRRDGVVYRQIDPSFADGWEAFLASGLYERLVSEGVLIPHEEVDPAQAAVQPAYRVIRPQQLELVTYPYEWAFGMLKDAALLTLRAQQLANEAGFTLRDASAYNVQFVRGRPLLIDSLSFEPAVADRPWAPYRQFCEQFLAPLALMARVDVRLLSLLRSHLEGIPLDLAARLLPGRTRLSLGLGPHIHLHARAQRRHADDASGRAGRETTMSAKRRATLIESLRDTTEGLTWEAEGTAWADYAEDNSYDATAADAKERAVHAALVAAAGTRAWDLGANTGRYSRVAAAAGYRVVAQDVDPAAVERGYQALKAEGRGDITPLLADIAQPSPPLGWGSRERAGLLERIEADADVVLALALIHHLAIGANVPLPMIAALLARLAPHAIVEFVPKEDAMVQRMLAARRDIFDGYSMAGLREAIAPRFDIVSETPIEGTLRTVLHLRRREAVGTPTPAGAS